MFHIAWMWRTTNLMQFKRILRASSKILVIKVFLAEFEISRFYRFYNISCQKYFLWNSNAHFYEDTRNFSSKIYVVWTLKKTSYWVVYLTLQQRLDDKNKIEERPEMYPIAWMWRTTNLMQFKRILRAIKIRVIIFSIFIRVRDIKVFLHFHTISWQMYFLWFLLFPTNTHGNGKPGLLAFIYFHRYH